MTEEKDREEILSIHDQVIQAHFDHAVRAWLDLESEEYISANRGEITYPTKEERAKIRQPYLQATEFTEYFDLIPPIVNISDDATLGWLIAQVQVKGIQTTADDETIPVEFISAWIELYKKVDGNWLCVGNVSNMKP